MKTRISEPSRWLAALLVSCLVGGAVNSTGQNKTPSAAPEVAARSGARPEYALEVADGMFVHHGKRQPATLTTVIDALRDMFPQFNFAMAPELAGIKVADLKLRAAEEPIPTPGGTVWAPSSLEETLAALRVATGYRFVWQRGWTAPVLDQRGRTINPNTGTPYGPTPAAGSIDPATGLPATPAPVENYSSLYTLTLDPEAVRPDRLVEVFNLRGYLQQLGSEREINSGLEEIKKMIATTLTTLNPNQSSAEESPEFQFHRGTSLLIVIGSPQAIEVTSKIVNALPNFGSGGGGGSGRNAEAEELFRKRYGLGPQPAPGQGRPGSPLPPLPGGSAGSPR